MKVLTSALLAGFILFSSLSLRVGGETPGASNAAPIFGFRDAAAENAVETRFLAVPDAKQAGENLRILTQAPHMAGTPEDKTTADFVAQKFRDAGLQTEIVE